MQFAEERARRPPEACGKAATPWVPSGGRRASHHRQGHAAKAAATTAEQIRQAHQNLALQREREQERERERKAEEAHSQTARLTSLEQAMGALEQTIARTTDEVEAHLRISTAQQAAVTKLLSRMLLNQAT